MKKAKALQMLNEESIHDLTQGETAYFQDCEDLNLLQSNNYREISESHVTALMESIQETGIQAEVAIVANEGTDGKIELTVEDGHHRLEAIRRLRNEAERSGRQWLYRPLPCRVRMTTADTVKGAFAIASVMRNQLRKEENLWDKLAAFERLREAGETTTAISKLVGLDERSVRRILSLKRVPDIVRSFAKQNEQSVKAATLYKLAAVIEKASTELQKGAASLLAEATKDAPERLSGAREIAVRFLATVGMSLECHEDQGAMIMYLALDQVARAKGEGAAGPGAEDGPRTSGDKSPSSSTTSKSPAKAPRAGGTKTKRTQVPDGWVALDPVRLESLMSDAGVPEEWREKVARLISPPPQ